MLKPLILILMLAPPIAAQNVSPWDGVYKLDYDKSNLAGGFMTCSKSADGAWHMVDGTDTSDLIPDGQPHPLGSPGLTQTATLTNDHLLTRVMQRSGETRTTITDTLSPDFKTLTEVLTAKGRDGSPYISAETFSRADSGTGFFARWNSIKVKITTSIVSTLTISTTSDGIVTWNYSGTDFLTGKPDGTPLPVTGPKVPPGDTIAFKAVSPRRMNFLTATNGKTNTEGYMQLSQDSKTLDDIYWDPADPTSKADKVYVRQ